MNNITVISEYCDYCTEMNGLYKRVIMANTQHMGHTADKPSIIRLAQPCQGYKC